MTTDWRTLLGEAAWLDPDGYDVHLLLATKVPDLCPDCKGTGSTDLNSTYDCTCPNAPTIARLLAIGEAVWTAEQDHEYITVGDRSTEWADILLAALKAVGE